MPFDVIGNGIGDDVGDRTMKIAEFEAQGVGALDSAGRFASAVYRTGKLLERLKSEIAAREEAESARRERVKELETLVRVRTRELERCEAFLAESQHLSQTGTFSWRLATDEVTWSQQLMHIYELEIGTAVTLDSLRTRVHPEDVGAFDRMMGDARGGRDRFEWQYRLMMPDHSIKCLHAIAHATRDQDGELEYIAAVQDVTARRLSGEVLDTVPRFRAASCST